ncbi:plasma protease C1 inhibitor isoform X2 [Candoia aspera]|uniref:plasma protease C1 inhibitor isoform X2 n=1 Tax=Candoia aspera TaxID=51853 RepID=UPI002FD7B600
MKTWLILLYLAITIISSFPQVGRTEETQQSLDPDANTKDDRQSWRPLKNNMKFQAQDISDQDTQGHYNEEETTNQKITSTNVPVENGEDSAITMATKQTIFEPLNGKEQPAEVPTEGSTTANTAPISTVSDTSCPLESCSPRWKPWPACAQSTPEDEQKLAEALSKFSLEFYRIATQKKDGNMVFSPLSITTTLSNLLLGACDETKDRLEKLLFYPKEFACVHRALKILGKSKALTSANAIFYQPALKMGSEFHNLTSTFYQTKLKPLTNNTHQSVTDINSWVSEHTGNKIKQLLDDLDPEAQMVLLNAVYFQSKWKTTFQVKHTRLEDFYLPGLPPIKVPTMTSKKYPVAAYFDNNLRAKVGRFQLFHNLSLVIFVPRTQLTNLSEIEERLDPTAFMTALAKLGAMPLKPTMVTLPKFKLESSQDLMTIIGEMDFGLFFDPDLCGITQSTEVAVSSAKHKAVLQISEEGVEGAAATAVTLARTATFFEVQQPFIFMFLRDNRVPLFLGRVTNPLSS